MISEFGAVGTILLNFELIALSSGRLKNALYGNLWELKQTQKSDKLITLNHLNQSSKEGVMNKTMTLTKSAIVVSLFFIMLVAPLPLRYKMRLCMLAWSYI